MSVSLLARVMFATDGHDGPLSFPECRLMGLVLSCFDRRALGSRWMVLD